MIDTHIQYSKFFTKSVLNEIISGNNMIIDCPRENNLDRIKDIYVYFIGMNMFIKILFLIS